MLWSDQVPPLPLPVCGERDFGILVAAFSLPLPIEKETWKAFELRKVIKC